MSLAMKAGMLSQLQHLSVPRAPILLERSQAGEMGQASCAVDAMKVLLLSLSREIQSLEEGQANCLSLTEIVNQFEAEIIRSALIQTGGRQRRAAHLLKMKVTTLHRKIKQHRLEAPVILHETIKAVHQDAHAISNDMFGHNHHRPQI